MPIDPSLQWLLASAIIVYLIAMYGVSYLAQRKVERAEDFLVAGRRLPFSLAWMTLLATWFGAGTLLTAADEVREGGLQRAALDPLGAGVCLLLAGWFVAGPMWKMQLLTVPDFFRRRFGSAAEMIASLILIPSYFGWIAAQFTALSAVLELFFGIPLEIGLVAVAVVGTGYTLMGGMWSVTLTDAIQIVLVLVGLLILAIVVLAELGSGDLWDGLQRIGTETAPGHLTLIPTDSVTNLTSWLGVFAVGALGNLPGQDLMQRVFACNSERTARRSCWAAGVLYLVFGALPLLLALGGSLLFPADESSRILPTLAHAFLHPVVAVVFLLAIFSAVLSTIDSAVLSPSSILAQNVLPRFGYNDTLATNRWCVLLVAAASLLLAFLGQDAYALLEESYLLTLVGLFVPLILGLYSQPRNRSAAVAAMLTGMAIWGLHFALGWETFLPTLPVLGNWQWPLSLAATAGSAVAYFLFEPPWRIRWARPGKEAPFDTPNGAGSPAARPEV